jgi:hypothetical protein
MVCAKHKDVPKAKIRKYRAARKAKAAPATAVKATAAKNVANDAHPFSQVTSGVCQ